MVLACGIIASFSWGLGFYGLGVYLHALSREHGWSAGLISVAVTVYYALSAGCRRLGPVGTDAAATRRYIGGLTPSRLTCMRPVGVSLPSAPATALKNTYSPGLSAERSAATAVTTGVPSGTRIFCVPSL